MTASAVCRSVSRHSVLYRTHASTHPPANTHVHAHETTIGSVAAHRDTATQPSASIPAVSEPTLALRLRPRPDGSPFLVATLDRDLAAGTELRLERVQVDTGGLHKVSAHVLRVVPAQVAPRQVQP